MKNKLISILKVSLCSPAYDVYYSIKEIFKSPAACLQASLTMAPDIRHDAANTILKKTLAMFMLVNLVKNKQI